MADFPVSLKSKDQLRLMLLDLSPVGTPVQVGHEREAALRVGGWNEHRKFSHQHGDELELWIKLVGQGDCLFIPSSIANRTLWPGASQSRISAEERYRSNIFLKELIAKELGERVSPGVRSYLALHWAVVAARNGMYGQAVRLGCAWPKRPHSILRLYAMRSSKDVLKTATRLDIDQEHPSSGQQRQVLAQNRSTTPVW